MRYKIALFAAVLATGLLFSVGSCLGEDAVQLKLSTDTIDISTFYNGTSLEATGTIPADSDVVLEVSGPKEDVHLKVKGKVMGILWMNKTDVSLENAPADYMLYYPENVTEDIFGPETGIGYEAVEQEITIEPASEDRAFVFREYVKLLEKSGVYAMNEGGVTYGPVADGKKPFSATLNIPSKMKPGEYHVRAITLANNQVTGRIDQPLTLRLTGFPAMISKLAFGSPLLFGIMAVIIAVATGLIIGTIFKGGGGAH
jgi:uncharacterized protein (TIGR02186 family)